MNSLQESAWLAGIIEGEGCISAYPRPKGKQRPSLRVYLKMVDKDVIEKAMEIMSTTRKIYVVDANKYKANKAIKEVNGSKTVNQPAYEITWGGTQAENLMRRIHPYMGARRKARIDEVLRMDLSHHQRRKDG